MPRTRIDLDAELRDAIGNSNVYFQPPESIKLKYPCIVYELSDLDVFRADNLNYKKHDRYDVTFITKDPDHPLIRELPDLFLHCRYNRYYAADNLNHYSYTIYY